MIDDYTIKPCYGGHSSKYNEVEIKSEGLIYVELCETHSGCQTKNVYNNDLIHEKCKQISKLIKEVDELNKT